MSSLNIPYVAGKLLILSILVCLNIRDSNGFVPNSLQSNAKSRLIPVECRSKNTSRIFASAGGDENDAKESEDIEGENVPSPRIEDVNDMTDRFKYKVHALMGDYDPTEGMVDDEGQDGNIMKALLTFPTKHVFDVVGKVSTDGDEEDGKDYADKVKSIVFDTTGDEEIKCEIIPRGKKFVKVRCEAKVESTTMINNIYDELGEMESTVMKF